jgi:hypothetical protein
MMFRRASKMSYMVIWPNRGQYRVFAKAKQPIRQRAWEKLFAECGGLGLQKITGLFEDWQPYKKRLTVNANTIIKEYGTRPVRLARTTELEDARRTIAQLENEVRKLRDENSQLRNFKRKAAEMDADESVDDPADFSTDESADEPADQPADESADESADEPADESADECADGKEDKKAEEAKLTSAKQDADPMASYFKQCNDAFQERLRKARETRLAREAREAAEARLASEADEAQA